MFWFRLYSEARTDAKLATLTDSEFRTWFNLLCYANDHEPRGTVDNADPKLLALEVAGGDVELLSRTIHKLVSLRILEPCGDVCNECNGVTSLQHYKAFGFIHWDKRQRVNPSDQPKAVKERVRRHRAKQAGGDRRSNNRRSVTTCNDSEQNRDDKKSAAARERESESTEQPAEAWRACRESLARMGYTAEQIDAGIQEVRNRDIGVKPAAYVRQVIDGLEDRPSNGCTQDADPGAPFTFSGRNDGRRQRRHTQRKEAAE